MNDISGSAAFKQDATDIMILHRQKDDADPFNLTVLPDGFILLPKVKTGISGSIKIRFVPRSAVMLDETEITTADYKMSITGEKQTELDMKF